MLHFFYILILTWSRTVQVGQCMYTLHKFKEYSHVMPSKIMRLKINRLVNKAVLFKM